MSFYIISHNVNSNRRPYPNESNDKIDTCSKEWMYLHSKLQYHPRPIVMLQEVSFGWSNFLIVNFQKEAYRVHYNPTNKTLIAYPDNFILNQMKTISLSEFQYEDVFMKLEKKIDDLDSENNGTGSSGLNIFSQFYSYFRQWVNETTPLDAYTDKSKDNAQKYIYIIKKCTEKICPVFNCVELQYNDYGKSILFANIVFRANVIEKNSKYLIWVLKILLFFLNKLSQDKGLVVCAYMPGVKIYSDIYKNITQPETSFFINDNDLYVPEIDRYLSNNSNMLCMNDAYILYNSEPPPCTRNTISNDTPIREICDYIFVNKNINVTEMNHIQDSMETIPNNKIHSDHYPFELKLNHKII